MRELTDRELDAVCGGGLASTVSTPKTSTNSQSNNASRVAESSGCGYPATTRDCETGELRHQRKHHHR